MSYYEIENLFMAGFMVNGMQFICLPERLYFRTCRNRHDL